MAENMRGGPREVGSCSTDHHRERRTPLSVEHRGGGRQVAAKTEECRGGGLSDSRYSEGDPQGRPRCQSCEEMRGREGRHANLLDDRPGGHLEQVPPPRVVRSCGWGDAQKAE